MIYFTEKQKRREEKGREFREKKEVSYDGDEASKLLCPTVYLCRLTSVKFQG